MHLQIANTLDEAAKQLRATINPLSHEETSACIGMQQAAVDLRAAYARRNPTTSDSANSPEAPAEIPPEAPAPSGKKAKTPKPE